jgi:hypothetical protein
MSKHYVYKIVRDEDLENPRTEYPQLATIYYQNGRKVLGDEAFSGDIHDCMSGLIEKYEPGFSERLDFKFGNYFPQKEDRRAQAEQCRSYIEEHFDRHYLWLPVYVYDHSGVTINTTGFSGWQHAAWDSYCSGMIAVSKEKVRQEYSWKKLTQARQAKVLKYLNNEVKEYDQYLSGDAHGFLLYEVPDHIIEEYLDDPDYDLQEVVEFLDLSECEEVESLYGFYSEEECEAQAKDCLKTWEETHYARLAREAGQLDLPLAA